MAPTGRSPYDRCEPPESSPRRNELAENGGIPKVSCRAVSRPRIGCEIQRGRVGLAGLARAECPAAARARVPPAMSASLKNSLVLTRSAERADSQPREKTVHHCYRRPVPTAGVVP